MSERPRVDPLAAAGFTEGAAAYERVRPEYPPAALDWLFSTLGLSADSRVLDLGAGTGKLTRGLVGRAGEVVAVEPLDAMRAELSRVLPGVEDLPGVAEAIPLEDASVAAVFSGEAFHWFSLEPALAEIRRVLVPRGGLAVLWNVPRWGGPWAREVGEAIERHRDTREHPWSHRPFGTFDEGMHGRADFTPVRTESFPNEHRYTAAGVVDQVASMSFIAALPEDARVAALAEVAGVLAAHGVEEAVLRWRCDAHVTVRVG
ncbi:MAG: smtA [Solirubrobacterales bacterium]|nr:smtA [Solirubrobacterales bacterium]